MFSTKTSLYQNNLWRAVFIRSTVPRGLHENEDHRRLNLS